MAKLAHVFYDNKEKANECAHDMKPGDRSGTDTRLRRGAGDSCLLVGGRLRRHRGYYRSSPLSQLALSGCPTDPPFYIQLMANCSAYPKADGTPWVKLTADNFAQAREREREGTRPSPTY